MPERGIGLVLAEVIGCEHQPVVRVTELFPQAAQSRIITSAHRINGGALPDLSNPGRHSAFYSVPPDDPESAVARRGIWTWRALRLNWSHMAEILIYGATGYTGVLIAERALERGLAPILAARDSGRLRALSDRLGCPKRAFDLSDPQRIRDGIRGVRVVLNVAGPFSATARPMADACIAQGIHYVDITGEIDVFEALAARDVEAARAGVTLLPGAGFDVVPSDCLAAHLKQRLPDAVRLRLAIFGLFQASRGTLKTAIEAIGHGARVRRGGRIIELETPPTAEVDFGEGRRRTIAVSWGDIATAWHSTGVPDIEVHFEAPLPLRLASKMPGSARRVLGSHAAQTVLKRIVERAPPGPTREQREAGRAVILGEAWNASGQRVAARMDTPEPYAFTAVSAVEVVERLLTAGSMVGFQTPSAAFGPEFALHLPGVHRTEAG